jgi:hypothetical protein
MKAAAAPLPDQEAKEISDFLKLCAASGTTPQGLRTLAREIRAFQRIRGRRLSGDRDNGPRVASLRGKFDPQTRGITMSNSLTVSGANPFVNYEPDVRSRRHFPGDILKFTKGDWTYGKDSVLLTAATDLVACMDTLTRGWQCWANKEVIDARLGLYVRGYKPPQRSQLGNLDKALWELDDAGKPKDPWVYINGLTFVARDGSHVYTYITSSDGGLSAVNALGAAAGKVQSGMYPLVALGCDSYQHKRREYGRVKIPVLRIVGSIERAVYDRAIDAAWGSGAPPMETSGLDEELAQLPPGREEPPPPDDADPGPSFEPDFEPDFDSTF